MVENPLDNAPIAIQILVTGVATFFALRFLHILSFVGRDPYSPWLETTKEARVLRHYNVNTTF